MAVSKADEAYMNQAAAIRLRAEIADSRGKVAELERDLAEQCRLLGMGASREARLMAQLASVQRTVESQHQELVAGLAREHRMRLAIQRCKFDSLNMSFDDLVFIRSAFEEIDDSALREMIKAARKEERETCAAICDELEQHYSDYKDAALLNGDVALSNAASGEPRAARSIAAAIRGRT